MQPWNADPEVRDGIKPNDCSGLCDIGRSLSHFATRVAFCDRSGRVKQWNSVTDGQVVFLQSCCSNNCNEAVDSPLVIDNQHTRVRVISEIHQIPPASSDFSATEAILSLTRMVVPLPVPALKG